MKLGQLQALVAIADTGSVRGAARALDVSPAAIAKSLRQLEECLQMQLVLRTPSGGTLTECGQTLLEHARLVVAQIARAGQAIDAMRAAPRGRLALAVTPWLAMTVLPEVVTLFRKRMPEIQLEFFEGTLSIANPRLRNGSLDFFIGRQTPGVASSEFSFRPLFASSLAVVVRQDHPLADCRSLAQLCDLDWLVALDPQTEGQVPFNMFSRHGLSVPRNIHFIHSLTIALALLQRTDMVSIFPWPLIEICARRDGLCAVPVREQLDDSMVGIITRSGHPLGAASACFIDCLIETIRDGECTNSPEIRRVLQSVELLI